MNMMPIEPRPAAVSRVAEFLLRLAECSGAIETGRLDLAMNRQDIADRLGLSVDAVCRALHMLAAARNIVIVGQQRIVLRNIEMLCELADGFVH
jgi:CRP-like cAMP-binding protein